MEDIRIIRTAIRVVALLLLIMYGFATPTFYTLLKQDIDVNEILNPFFKVVDFSKVYPNLNYYFTLLFSTMFLSLKVFVTFLLFLATTEEMSMHHPSESICLSQTSIIFTVTISVIDAISLFSQGGVFSIQEGLFELGLSAIGMGYLVYRFVKLLKIEEAKMELKNQGFGTQASGESGRGNDIKSRRNIPVDSHVFVL